MKPVSIPRALACAGLCIVATAILTPGEALAAVTRTVNVSSTGVCDAPLPVYNDHLRRRPVAVQNESSEPVFVSCTLPTDTLGARSTGSVRVSFKSTAGAATVNCTMVSGTRGAQVMYVPKGQALAAGSRATLEWTAIDKWSSSGTYSFSCTLPPGVAMETISHTQTDSAGRL